MAPKTKKKVHRRKNKLLTIAEEPETITEIEVENKVIHNASKVQPCTGPDLTERTGVKNESLLKEARKR